MRAGINLPAGTKSFYLVSFDGYPDAKGNLREVITAEEPGKISIDHDVEIYLSKKEAIDYLILRSTRHVICCRKGLRKAEDEAMKWKALSAAARRETAQ